MGYGSKDIASAAICMAMTTDRSEERKLKEMYKEKSIKSSAVDYGGDFSNSIMKMIERAVVSAKREGVIGETHAEEGAVAGAAHEALSQIAGKAAGLSVGGKIGIARFEDHISVAIFFTVGLLNLNEVAIGLGHRVA